MILVYNFEKAYKVLPIDKQLLKKYNRPNLIFAKQSYIVCYISMYKIIKSNEKKK
jgi:hypothetical protein